MKGLDRRGYLSGAICGAGRIVEIRYKLQRHCNAVMNDREYIPKCFELLCRFLLVYYVYCIERIV